MYTGEFSSEEQEYTGEIYTGKFSSDKFSKGYFSAVEFNKGESSARAVLHGGNIRAPLYRCGWFIRSGSLDNLAKCACWRGEVLINWRANISVNFFKFGEEAISFWVKLCINKLKFTHPFQKTLQNFADGSFSL